MKTIGPLKTYEFTVTEVRKYVVQGCGHSEFEAEQDVISRFHRLTKSGDLVAHDVSRPRIDTRKRVR